MKKYLYFLPLIAIAIMATSCTSWDSVYNENASKQASEANFVKAFGEIASDQTWNTVSQRTATISVNLGTSESYTVGIYNDDPLFNASDCGLLAQGTVSDGGSVNLTFDSPTTQTKYYVGLFDSKGRSIEQLDSLTNNVLNVTFGGNITSSAKAKTRASADDSSTSTAYSTYLKASSDFSIPEFSNAYYDISKMSSGSSIKLDETVYLQENNYTESFKYGDGKHYYIPSGKTIKADLYYSKQKDKDCVIYVEGTWEVPSTVSFTNEQQIVVANGGKIIFDNDANFNSGARFINQGTIETSNKTICIENWSGTNADCYNSGVMTLNDGGLSIAGNNSQVYNSGTMTMNYLDARGSCLFTNYGTFTAKSTTKGNLSLSGQGTAASNFRLINGCHTSIDAMGVYQLIVVDNSRVDCSTGIYTGGGQNTNYVCLGNKSEVSAGDWTDNGGHIYGSTSSNEYSIFKFTGNVSESSAGAFITKGYVYFDGTFSTDYHVNAIRTGDGDVWNKGICKFYIKYTSTEKSSKLTIPAGECTGTGYNPGGDGGDIPVTAPTYTIAYEDLGATDDFDFNDIVLYIYPYTTTNKLKVDLVAAGGILPVTVYYNNTTLFTKSDGKMTNTTTRGSVISTATVDLPSGFTMADSKYTSLFKIEVKGSSSSYTINPNTTAGSAPQALVIAGAWAWPLERVQINTAYTRFSDWVANSSVDWISSKVDAKCIK